MIGGGSTPEQSIPTCLIVLEHQNPVAAERQLRLGEPPVIARIDHDRLVLDLRTVFEEEQEDLARALKALVQ